MVFKKAAFKLFKLLIIILLVSIAIIAIRMVAFQVYYAQKYDVELDFVRAAVNTLSSDTDIESKRSLFIPGDRFGDDEAIEILQKVFNELDVNSMKVYGVWDEVDGFKTDEDGREIRIVNVYFENNKRLNIDFSLLKVNGEWLIDAWQLSYGVIEKMQVKGIFDPNITP